MYKEKIREMVENFRYDEMALDLIYDMLESMNKYVNVVNSMENTIHILRFRLESAEFRVKVQELDMNRRLIHNSLIANVKAVNRLLTFKDMEKFFTGDEENRYQIADFAGKVVNEGFEKRKR